MGWEMGLDFCCPGKMGLRTLGLGFGKKNMGWEMGLDPPPSGPCLNYPVFFFLIPSSSKFKYFQPRYVSSPGFKPFSYLISVRHLFYSTYSVIYELPVILT